MKKWFFGTVLAAGLSLGNGWAMDALRFAIPSDVPVDVRARMGSLPNGLHYHILPHGEPPGRVSLRLIIGSGSLVEREDQRGLAHYLEHIAFCGSENFPGGDLVEYLQRQGVRFGHHSNAYTGFEETVYQLELPKTDRQSVKEGLVVLRDFLAGLTIAEAEVRRERGVILSELLHIDSPDYREALARYNFLFPNAVLSKRFPIGERSVVESMDAKKMRKFYETFYVPGNAAVVVVGDVDPVAVERAIALVFGDIAAGSPPPAVDLGTLEVEGLRVALHREPELPQARIIIATQELLDGCGDCQDLRGEELRQKLGHWVLTRRLEQLAKAHGAVFFDGGSHSTVNLRSGLHLTQLQLTCCPEKICAALPVAEEELRRALEFPFSQAEVDRAARSILKNLDDLGEQEDSLRSDKLIGKTVDAITSERVPSSASWDATFAHAILDGVAAETVWQSFCRLWAPQNRSIFLAGNFPETLREETVRTIYGRSQRTMLTPWDGQVDAPFAYENFGSPSAVVEQWQDEDLQLHRYRFANGMRLNVRPTDFETGQVRFRLRVGHGLLTEPLAGLAHFADWAFVEGGLGRHSWEDLRNMLVGHSVQVNFSAGVDAFLFSGRSTRSDLLLQLQLLAAFLQDPGYREEGEREAGKAIAQVYPALLHTPDGAMVRRGEMFLHGGDRRFGFPEQVEMERLTMADLRLWLTPQLRNGYCELSIVGDVDVDGVVDAVAKTLGALPTRTGLPPPRDVPMTIPAGQNANFSYESDIPKGLLLVLWATDDCWDIGQKRRLDLLADILQDRLRARIRKELGDTYSPHVSHHASTTFKGYGLLRAEVLAEVDRIHDVAYFVHSIAEDLRCEGMGEDEFLRAKLPAISEIQEQLRHNSYWLNAIDGIQARPERLEFIRTLLPFYEQLERKDLLSVLPFLKEERRMILKICPEERL
ncbi:MAG: insulinase family protein [Puniceicoccales bacterium]|jgi:zinc protease|nr:insulinase family protein [Puniceicoccales bacterium]